MTRLVHYLTLAPIRWRLRSWKYEREREAKLEAARKRGDSKAVNDLRMEKENDDYCEYQDSEVAYTKGLLRDASRLRVRWPEGHPGHEENVNWSTSSMTGERYLTDAGEAELKEALYTAEARKREAREHYMKIVSPVVTLAIGLLGAVTGLIAVCAKVRK
jgi:hypothetical protein